MFTPTPEQEKARELFATGDSLAIEALAGTGKTASLALLAADAPNRRGQFVAFNKSIVTDAAGRFPSSVQCSTAHSLAFRAVGRRYSHRLNAARMSSTELARRLGVDPFTVESAFGRKVLQPGYLASLAMKAISAFCQSADEVPGPEHVPYVDGIDMPRPDGRRTYDNNRQVRAHLAAPMAKAWDDLSRVDGQLPFRHDAYLKLWGLSHPRIGAEFILLDEAQDTDSVLAKVIAEQAGHAQVVVVGDANQAIYEWRGAIDALSGFDVDHRTHLTRSFRFGPAVATVANRVLAMLDTDLRLSGTDTIASVVGAVDDPDAVLCRTNATAVDRVLAAQMAGQRPHLVGGGDDVRRFAEAAAELKAHRGTGHPDLACFDNWGQVQDYVRDDPSGSELKLLVSLVDKYGTVTIKRALGNMPREDAADLIVSTAHKAKGREWASVQLAGDFCVAPKDIADDEQYDPSASEKRLLYVALTRGRLRLDPTRVELFSARRTKPAADPLLPEAVIA